MAANVLIFVAKTTTALIKGSSALLAESYHSSIEFHSQGSIDALEQTIDRITRKIQQQNPVTKQVYLEATARHASPVPQKKAS